MAKWCPHCDSKMKYDPLLDGLKCPDCGYSGWVGPEFPDIELSEERGDDWDEIGAVLNSEVIIPEGTEKGDQFDDLLGNELKPKAGIGSLPFAITLRYPDIESLALWARKEKNRRGR